ncbi:MAG: hypothetical protein M1819_003222 [Sarea resinae]|nr:MAG: hypothetical protein M1819_003222 [Sarea resinae]
MSPIDGFLKLLGDEVTDPEEESFLLFTQSIPSQNLGFVDPKSSTIALTISSNDLLIHQSPTLLSSNRTQGTTGAVVWKITPLFAAFISDSSNIFFRSSIITPHSDVLELGTGVSGIVALTLAPKIGIYIATDQDYVLKLLRQNISENQLPSSKATESHKKKIKASHSKRGHQHADPKSSIDVETGNVHVMPLDWETDSASSLPTQEQMGLDALIACDCIYNEALVAPFVQTCRELCNIRRQKAAEDNQQQQQQQQQNPTVCIVAQQLRSPDVFEAWLREFHRWFRVWRLPDEVLMEGLRENSGFVVHVGILRETPT